MKAECKTVETRQFFFTADDVYDLCAKHIQEQYGVKVSSSQMQVQMKSHRYYDFINVFDGITVTKESKL